MPRVQIKDVGENLTLEQGQDMIRRVTEAILSVEGVAHHPVCVTIQDGPPGALGVGSWPVTGDDLRALAGQITHS